MFRKLLCLFLAVQHFYVFTCHDTLQSLSKDTIEVTREEKTGTLSVKLFRKSDQGAKRTLWPEHKLTVVDERFENCDLANLTGYQFNFTNHNSFFQIKVGKSTFIVI